MAPLEKQLIEAMTKMEIIDTHEHVGPEEERVNTPVEVFDFFLSNSYSGYDLRMAGMSESDCLTVQNRDIPLDERWNIFAPYWERIRWTSYSRAILLATEKFYGESDINEKNFATICERIARDNKPGIYHKVLREACNIRFSLTQTDLPNTKTDLLIPLDRVLMQDVDCWETLSHPPFAQGQAVSTLDDYLDICRDHIVRCKEDGVVGLKTISLKQSDPDRQEALSQFEKLKSGKVDRLVPPRVFPNWQPCTALRTYIVDELIAFAGLQGLPIAVHTGYWGDFRDLDPLHVIPMLQRHPDVRFDIYHLGYPWCRQVLMLCKGFANVWVNLCWTHVISQCSVVQALDEAIDLLPTNKILAFGGDYNSSCLELIYGHLVMARENIAKVLARRITERQMTETQALDLAKKWFWDNPVELYRLNV